ncbi:MAG: hypothetical protein Q9194_004707 [Teloschistes cf. exilis]
MAAHICIMNWPESNRLERKTRIRMTPNARAMNAKRLLPQPRPKLSYIIGPARGKTAPSTERRTVAAASADAA